MIMFNMKCPICGNNLYTNSTDNTLVRCENDDCITCGLDFVRQECFSETKEEIINRCIFIYSERIEDYKRYLRYAVRERNEINNKKDYGCPNCWQIVKPRIYKYIKSYHLIKRTGYFYGCPLCRSSKIINMQNGKQTRQRFVCIAYWYNHICTKIKAKREKK